MEASVSIFFLHTKDRQTELSATHAFCFTLVSKGSADTHNMVDTGPTLDQIPRHFDVVVDDRFHQRSPEVFVLRIHIGPSLAGNKTHLNLEGPQRL